MNDAEARPAFVGGWDGLRPCSKAKACPIVHFDTNCGSLALWLVVMGVAARGVRVGR